MHRALAELLTFYDVIARRDYSQIATLIDYALRKHEIVSVFPGVYARPETAQHWRTIASAVPLWDPAAVIVGEAAAAFTFWETLQPSTVEVVTARRIPPRPFVTFRRRHIPRELIAVRAGMRYSTAELTAIDLIRTHGSDVIDTALRSRMVTLAGLHRALELTSGRDGNAERRRVLVDSRMEPWSALERLAHRRLYAAGIGGWKANVPIVCHGHTFYQDIAMTRSRLSIELDGYETHCSREAFEQDRRRGNYLMLAGRQVLHFTWLMVRNEPDYFTRTVRAALALS
jgi:very-short-patch-repair endonuclease